DYYCAIWHIGGYIF
nr:immunoglobulin light chain junction region [Macaca mulatta]